VYFVLIYFVLSLISILSSIPIALSNSMTFVDVICDYFASLTYCGVIGGVFLLSRIFTKIKFNPSSKLWKVSEKEVAFYEKLKVKKWKKIVPDFGFLVGFKKNLDGADLKSSEFYKRFIYESVNASITHFSSIIFSPVIFLFLHKEFYLSIGLPCILIVFILDIIPIMLQRYNRPRLLKMYQMTLRREERAKNKVTN